MSWLQGLPFYPLNSSAQSHHATRGGVGGTQTLQLFLGPLQSPWCLSRKGNPCLTLAQRESQGQGTELPAISGSEHKLIAFHCEPCAYLPCLFLCPTVFVFPPWCQCLYFQSPDSSVSMLCSIPCSPLPLPFFPPHLLSHLDGVLDWPSHTLLSWVTLCQARAAHPGLTLGVSDPSMPLGRAS